MVPQPELAPEPDRQALNKPTAPKQAAPDLQVLNRPARTPGAVPRMEETVPDSDPALEALRADNARLTEAVERMAEQRQSSGQGRPKSDFTQMQASEKGRAGQMVVPRQEGPSEEMTSALEELRQQNAQLMHALNELPQARGAASSGTRGPVAKSDTPQKPPRRSEASPPRQMEAEQDATELQDAVLARLRDENTALRAALGDAYARLGLADPFDQEASG